MQIYLIIHVGVQTVCLLCNMLKIILTADCIACYISVSLWISRFHSHFMKSRSVTKCYAIMKHINLNCYKLCLKRTMSWTRIVLCILLDLETQIALHTKHIWLCAICWEIQEVFFSTSKERAVSLSVFMLRI
jgi:hypothetical protein